MKKRLKIFLLLFAFCATLQFLPGILGYLFTVAPFERLSPTQWTAQVATLPAGHYYVSVGRPHGACNVVLDSMTLASDESLTPEVRTHLFLGADFYVDSRHTPQKLAVACEPQGGFSASFPDTPVIALRIPGLILQWLRELVDSLLGPVVSLVLLLSIVFMETENRKKLKVKWSFFLFSVTAFVYSVSLGEFFSLFLEGTAGAQLHILLRVLFSFSFIALCGSYTRQRYSLWVLHGALFLILCGCCILAPERVVGVYYVGFCLFLLSVSVVVWDLLSAGSKSLMVEGLGLLSSVWLLFLIRDIFILVFSEGFSSAPIMITMLTSGIIYFRHKEGDRAALEFHALKSELQSRAVLAQFSEQVMHDIRSPLAFLKVLSSENALVPDLRAPFSLVVARLEVLIGQLREKRVDTPTSGKIDIPFMPSAEMFKLSSIGNVVEDVIVQKRLEVTSLNSIQLIFETQVDAKVFNSCIQPVEFARVLSNILNNAVEATGSHGKIKIGLSISDSNILIRIVDEGRGISREQLSKIGVRGNSFGKEGGSGLGLFHARHTVEFWGGRLAFESVQGEGTTVLISLPKY